MELWKIIQVVFDNSNLLRHKCKYYNTVQSYDFRNALNYMFLERKNWHLHYWSPTKD